MMFFFHAEDGIRCVAGTGVQTCALPISGALDLPLVLHLVMNLWVFTDLGRKLEREIKGARVALVFVLSGVFGFVEIGRASCRERSGYCFGVLLIKHNRSKNVQQESGIDF